MKPILSMATIFTAAVLPMLGQQTPKPKSQKEVDALKKVQADAQANNLDQEILDINAVLENFADTEYKDMLLNMAMEASRWRLRSERATTGKQWRSASRSFRATRTT
jgi:hypothetical protein